MRPVLARTPERATVTAAFGEALRLGERYAWVCLPLYPSDGRWKPPYPFRDLLDDVFSLELIERLWDGHHDAAGVGAIWPADIVEAEADSDAGTEWLRLRKLPRTPTFSSRRGPHYLFRGAGNGLNANPSDGVEVLSRDGGKRLLVLPPTPPKAWLPSLSPYDVDLVPLPPTLRAPAQLNGHGKRVQIQLGTDLPPGEAHERMLSIVGRLANVLPPEELWTTARALNAGRLPDFELRGIVTDIAGKAGDAGRYFERVEGFVVPRLATEIAEAFDIRVGAGRHLYWYRGGVFLDTGHQQIEKAARRALGERYKRRHAGELLAWFRSEQQQIPDEPDPRWINVTNGMLDWRTGHLEPHSPEYLSTIQLPVAWDADATCPAIDRFLGDVLPEDAQPFVREVTGYAMYPGSPLRKAVMCLGPGSNGKSTYLSLVRAALGKRNTSSVPLQNFAESRFAAAEVYGKLANICGDLDARALRRSDLFKTLTGGTDRVMAERKFEDPFEFVPVATMFFSANEPPPSSDQTDAYFDRWLILPFERRFDANADPHLLSKLTTREELEGFLVQVVSALMDLMERGRFDVPPSVQGANEEYRSRIDTVATFIEEGCELAPSASTTRSRLYEGYREWCGRNGRIAISQQSFAPRVRTHLRVEIAAGSVEESNSGALGRPWRGVGLRA